MIGGASKAVGSMSKWSVDRLELTRAAQLAVREERVTGTIRRVCDTSISSCPGQHKASNCFCIAAGAEPSLLLLSLSARSSFLRLPATDALKE